MSTDLKPLDAPTPRVQGSSVRMGDRVFTNLTRLAGIFVLVLMAAIGAFLVWKAIPAFQDNTGNFFTTVPPASSLRATFGAIEPKPSPRTAAMSRSTSVMSASMPGSSSM